MGDADRLEQLRARVRRSVEDPRPSLTETEADAQLAVLFSSDDNARGEQSNECPTEAPP